MRWVTLFIRWAYYSDVFLLKSNLVCLINVLRMSPYSKISPPLKPLLQPSSLTPSYTIRWHWAHHKTRNRAEKYDFMIHQLHLSPQSHSQTKTGSERVHVYFSICCCGSAVLLSETGYCPALIVISWSEDVWSHRIYCSLMHRAEKKSSMRVVYAPLTACIYWKDLLSIYVSSCI